jgi:hypothetical protein
VGLYKSEVRLVTHSLEAPDFNHCTYQVRIWFQSLLFQISTCAATVRERDASAATTKATKEASAAVTKAIREATTRAREAKQLGAGRAVAMLRPAGRSRRYPAPDETVEAEAVLAAAAAGVEPPTPPPRAPHAVGNDPLSVVVGGGRYCGGGAVVPSSSSSPHAAAAATIAATAAAATAAAAAAERREMDTLAVAEFIRSFGPSLTHGGFLPPEVGRCTLTPPDPELKGAWYPGGFNPCTYQVKNRFQILPFNATCTATRRWAPRGASPPC